MDDSNEITPVAEGWTEMVCGFAFVPSGQVILIQKNHPDWMAGHLNGVGGHVEEGEYAFDAMVREFEEETGVPTERWGCLAVMDFPATQARIYFFRTNLTYEQIGHLTQKTDEQIMVLRTEDLARYQHVGNLDWLIPLAVHQNHQDAIKGERYTSILQITGLVPGETDPNEITEQED